MRSRLFLLITDVILLSAAFFVSSGWCSMEGRWVLLFYAFLLITKIFFFVRVGLYNAILRYAGMPLAATIIKVAGLSSLLSLMGHFLITPKIPTAFCVTDFLMTSFCVGLVRFAPRYFSESGKEWGQKRILIYGAGELGEQVARKLLRDPGEYFLVGFLDDGANKIGKKLHNLRIFGPLSDLSSLLDQLNISELIIAISELPGEVVRNITHECRKYGVICRIVPTFSDMLKKDVNIKNLDIADLLRRDPKDLDEPQIRRLIKGKVIAITGAAGSIGSELSRQCLRYGAKKLILIDYSEYNLYCLQEELSSQTIPIRFCLTHILHEGGLESIMQEEKPSIVLHAAAYKHVHIVEENPFEGVQNNVLGTMRVAELAEKYGVETFVLISTDKAVRPTSIMGASKRVAELYIQNFNARSKTEFLAVRFGNVLGSSGSVIPKFIEQINKGGPVTVTHPEVTRYFMLVSEAVQLVLQAASIGNGGEVFILNMGQPVCIAEMAEDLIFLSGHQPHKDIQIEFTGLRPGEKLYEEILIDETEKKTQYENITVGKATYLNWESLLRQLETLFKQVNEKNRWGMLVALKALVPEFSREELRDREEKNVLPLYRVQ